VPGSIAKGIRATRAIAGDKALERHRYMANRFPCSIFLLAGNNVRIGDIGRTGIEVENQRESAISLCLGRRCDPKQRKADAKK
jgi:hypothetical protein